MAKGPNATETRHFRTLFSLGAAGMLTDGQLLERFATRDGDRAELAFAALVERHGSMVLRVARAVLRDEHSAHDTFQATFLILARKAGSLWVRDSLGPWLHAVAFRVASGTRSLEGRHRRHEHNASRPEAFEPRDRDRSDLARTIHEEIERLPQPYRLAVVTCHLEGLTQLEAAHRLGWPVGTLQSRLARGRQRLRESLQRRGFAPSLTAITGNLAPVPNALLTSTAKAAATLNLGGAIAGMIAPTVLAMIETATKGMLMTKLKLGAVALVMVCGLVGSGLGLGVGRPVRATDEPVPSARLEPARPDSTDSNSPNLEDPASAIPPPADGPGFPYLLEFFETQSVVGLKSHQEVATLTRHGYPIKSFDVAFYGPNNTSPGRPTADRYNVNAYPTILLVDGAGEEIARIGALEGPAKIAAFYNENRSKPAKKPRSDWRPNLTNRSKPKPWETVVRVKVHFSDKEWGFGSGTIIQSTDSEAIVLTGAHIFRRETGGTNPPPKEYQAPIMVDLFDGKLTGRQSDMVGRSDQDLRADVIDFDHDADIALLRVRTSRCLPASPVIPPNWPFKKGMNVVAMGCSSGNDATVWNTTILDFWVTLSLDRDGLSVSAFKCGDRPDPGRSGGGLFTPEGYLAGVCAHADPTENAGLYTCPGAIHRLLDRNGLTSLYYRKPLASNGAVSIDPLIDRTERALVEPSNPQDLDDPVASKAEFREPAISGATLPKPWETVVRIRLVTPGRPSTQQSGTVIRSSKNESIILTTAHGFRSVEFVKGIAQSKVMVDLFGGKHATERPLSFEIAVAGLTAEFVNLNDNANLALLRIKPGRVLPVSPIAPVSWNPTRGMSLLTAGCPIGSEHATVWNTVLFDTATPPEENGAMPMPMSGPSPNVLKCAHEPNSGRWGGGLFTPDGHLAGVCLSGGPDDTGLYARPESIRKELERSGLSRISDRNRPGNLDPEADSPAIANPSKSISRGAPIVEKSILPPTAEPAPNRRVSDQDRRLNDLERKLDQVLKALEDLKGEKPPELFKGDFPLRKR